MIADQRQKITNLISEFQKSLQLPPDLLPSEWADRNYILPETSNMPGPWRTDNTPHLKFIMDSYVNPEVEEITVMGSAQIGKTSFLLIIIGYTIDIIPQPVLMLLPTLDVARSFSDTKLRETIDDTPVLKQKVRAKRGRGEEGNKLFMLYPGGYLKMVGGNSPHGLRQMSIPIIISDDINSLEPGQQREGDPILRAEKRAQTFEGRRKKIRCSTPTRKNIDRIEKFYKQGSQHKYHVPCPKCGTMQILKWENVTWEKELDMFGEPVEHFPETARIKCIDCGHGITEGERQQMLKRGTWVADNPKVTSHLSFHINELSSTLSSLKTIVNSYIKAQGNEESYEAFVNTTLGESYEVKHEVEYDSDQLMERIENYMTDENPFVPEGVLVLTMGVDVQVDRLEAQVCGWGEGEECWVLGYFKIYGDIDDRKVYDELDNLRKQTWKRADGMLLKISLTLIDSGYQGKMKMVYDYCFRRRFDGVRPSKGVGRYAAPLTSSSKVYDDRLTLVRVGTNEAKSHLYETRLKITEPGPKYIHFTEEYCDDEYFKQLASEVGIIRKSGMVTYTVYVKKDGEKRNEALDTWLLNYAAISIQPVNWNALKKRIELKRGKLPSEETEEVKADLAKKEVKPKPVQRILPRRQGGFVNNW